MVADIFKYGITVKQPKIDCSLQLGDFSKNLKQQSTVIKLDDTRAFNNNQISEVLAHVLMCSIF